MAGSGLDDPALLAAMTRYVDSVQARARTGTDDREVLDAAERVSLAGLELRQRLVELGWSAPAADRALQG